MPARAPVRSAWLALAAFAGVAFLTLALVVAERGSVGFDEPVGALVKGLPIPEALWLALTWLGGALLVVIGIGLVLAVLAGHRIRDAAIFGVALVGASVWTTVVKVTVARARPPDALIAAAGFSFPSGHTLNSTVTYGLAAMLVWRSGLTRPLRVAVTIALGVLVVGIGVSRIALGVHYPSDVAGGWLAGLAIVAAVAGATGAPSEGT